MKNLLVFISPNHSFDTEREILARVQIDNSLSLGWDKRDILLVTNFNYEYNGVKSILVGDEHWYKDRPRSIKTAIIPYLIESQIVDKNSIYWDHDFDAYQMNPMTDNEIELMGDEIGLTDYGWRDRWCLGSFFFRSNSKDIFERIKPIIYKNIEDESAMMELCADENIGDRCRRLNITYNFGMRQVGANWKRAIKPIRVVHFHPWYPLVKTLDIFMYGKSGLGHPIINDRLKGILNDNGIK